MVPDYCVQDFSRKSIHKFMGNPHPMSPSPVPQSPAMPRVQDLLPPPYSPAISLYILLSSVARASSNKKSALKVSYQGLCAREKL